MVGFKVVIGTKDGKCVQKEVSEEDSKNLMGKKIGEAIKGEILGLTGYEFEITGGTDYAGFPMRKDIAGMGRKRILAVSGIGLKKKAKGIRKRKTVCGNTIHAKISQINLKVLKEGKEKLAAAPKEGEAPKEAPKEEKKEVPKEAPKEEKKEAPKETPKETPKEEAKPEEKK
ncbi:30S ribosomal protein S6e [Candidatus Woesearchaeota archaeon]|nr:30S ribosomal protein S6e [Candidatus Woesearchaeota archaeon]